MVDPLEIRDVFDRAASLPPKERGAFLARACGTNEALRHEVERLLAADARLGSAFDTEPGSDPATGSSAAAAMSLQPGTRLGPYEIVDALGVGGMGEVYKARDTRLDRTVAIKVLSHELTADPSARQRFDREARAIAALSHPHICGLHDVGHQDDVDFLVMEFLDGETLAARLRRGKLPLADALTCAIHIADALATAHRAGIVHRDLKPGNIMLTSSGVKLLDFGLAKRRHQPIAGDITNLTAEPFTQPGMILGTVQYMAPEQLEGWVVDERTDIFAFGVVLYETLTGRRAFEGASIAALIGNILHAQPLAPSSLERLTPRALDDLVRRCLAKDPDARWPSIADVQHQLEAVRDSIVPARGRGSLVWAGALAAAVLAAIVGLVSWQLTRPPGPTTSLVSSTPVQRSLTRLTFDQGLQTDPAFSPDGRFIAYASDKSGNFDIWVQQLSGGDAVQVTKSAATDTQPAWSPDGSTIAFRSERDGGGIYVVPALGGAEVKLTALGERPSWSPDGSEVWFIAQTFTHASSVLRAVSLDGGASREILPEFTGAGDWQWIGRHPDGRVSFLGSRFSKFGFFTVSSGGDVLSSDLGVLPQALKNSLDNVIFSRTRFEWDPSGTTLLLEVRSLEGVWNLWRVRVDPGTLGWTRVERLTTGAGDDVAPGFSSDGTRVTFVTQRASTRIWQYTPIGSGLKDGRPLSPDGGSALSLDASPDGDSVLYNFVQPGRKLTPRWWLIRPGRAPTELAGADGHFARLSRNGERIAYTKMRTDESGRESANAIAVRTIGGREHLITPWVPGACCRAACDWTPDDRFVLTCGHEEMTAWPVDEATTAQPSRVIFRRAQHGLWQGQYSPNGRWLVFETLRSMVAGASLGVTAVEGPPDRPWTRVPLRQRWADKPRWSADGKTLYFLAADSSFIQLWAARFDPVRGVVVGEPVQLTHFDSPSFKISPAMSSTEMDVGGGKVFLTMESTSGSIWMLDNVDR